ncbi:Bifunctional purine biosynthesis protein PurH [Tilletia horrida]|uniref:Bifunctional purine biosynthesis protein PurH n=1 Tax=Tilletia horrida TaxID=155126 RepID=A0AAN6JSD0_9BASI|nr:Bifunctional purine biosynthesis protein PurH [Tilletia horrida]KAK0535623.1 Bifunctional purine biosynthesis protein PurH [Tilletia horrida]KAK0561565.1 Bifunctional purine biosynthesis protein PurH [Tilletia horrida]
MAGADAATRPVFGLLVAWIAISAFNYGFGISELNPLQRVLSCSPIDPKAAAAAGIKLPPCVPMSDSEFGLITAFFTLGGFLGSLFISPVSSRLRWGRRAGVLLSAVLNACGAALLSVAAAQSTMSAARFLQGLGAGIGVVVVPLYLNEISPPTLQGSIGVLNQLGIVIGIMVAQALGALPSVTGPQAKATAWRMVPLVSCASSLFQLLLGGVLPLCGIRAISESPVWLEENEGRRTQPGGASAQSDAEEAGGSQAAHNVRKRLWGQRALLDFDQARRDHGETAAAGGDSEQEQEGLLASAEGGSASTRPRRRGQDLTRQLSFFEIWSDKDTQRGLALVVFTQLAQQLSGINAVLYFSTGILKKVLPASAELVGLGITVINALMTFPPIYLIDERRFGRRKLLLSSAGTMSAFALLLGVSINGSWRTMSAVAIVGFVAAFSVGLGPVPFLILPELVPTKAVSAASSAGLSINWIANFAVGSLFLPIRSALANLDGGQGGSVFWIFAVVNATSAVVISRRYRYEARSA